MIVDKVAIRIDGPVSEAVGPLIEHAVGLQEAAVVNLFTVGVLDHKLYPRLVQVAHFGKQRMADVLVLYHDHHLYRFVRR